MTAGRPVGYPKTGGRKAGTPNKTPGVRAVFERVFNELQNDPDFNLQAFARAYPVEFYKLAGKLIPVDVAVQGALIVNVTSGVPHTDDGADLV